MLGGLNESAIFAARLKKWRSLKRIIKMQIIKQMRFF